MIEVADQVQGIEASIEAGIDLQEKGLQGGGRDQVIEKSIIKEMNLRNGITPQNVKKKGIDLIQETDTKTSQEITLIRITKVMRTEKTIDKKTITRE